VPDLISTESSGEFGAAPTFQAASAWLQLSAPAEFQIKWIDPGGCGPFGLGPLGVAPFEGGVGFCPGITGMGGRFHPAE
jgi:hypothetical protein